MTIDISIDGVSLQDLAAQVRLIERSQLDMAELVGGELDTTKARVAALEELVASMKAALDDTNTGGGQTPPVVVEPPVVVDPPVVTPPVRPGRMPKAGNVLVHGKNWTRYYDQIAALSPGRKLPDGWGRFMFGQSGSGQHLFTRSDRDKFWTVGETIDALNKVAPGVLFSITSGPSAWPVEAARPNHPKHQEMVAWFRTFGRLLKLEQDAGRVGPVMVAWMWEYLAKYQIGLWPNFAVRQGHSVEDFCRAWVLMDRESKAAGANIVSIHAPNAAESTEERDLVKQVVEGINRLGGQIDATGCSYYDTTAAMWPRVKPGMGAFAKSHTLESQIDLHASLLPGVPFVVNEHSTKDIPGVDRLDQIRTFFDVCAERKVHSVKLFSANKQDGDWRVFDDGDAGWSREVRAVTVEAANSYISKVRA